MQRRRRLASMPGYGRRSGSGPICARIPQNNHRCLASSLIGMPALQSENYGLAGKSYLHQFYYRLLNFLTYVRACHFVPLIPLWLTRMNIGRVIRHADIDFCNPHGGDHATVHARIGDLRALYRSLSRTARGGSPVLFQHRRSETARSPPRPALTVGGKFEIESADDFVLPPQLHGNHQRHLYGAAHRHEPQRQRCGGRDISGVPE